MVFFSKPEVLTLLIIFLRDKVKIIIYFQTSQSTIDLSSERDFDFVFYIDDGNHSW